MCVSPPISWLCSCLMLTSIVVAVTYSGPLKRKNVLFMVADDLRPQLGCYSGPHFPSPVHPPMVTPNLDELASGSLLLKRAYVQQAVCSPSRTSLLTGRRPDTTHVYDLQAYFRDVGGNYTTIPQYFKQQGYHSVGMGKVFHPGAASGHDDPISWSEPYYHPPYEAYWDLEKEYSWKVVNESEQRERPLPDVQLASRAIDTMRRLAPEAKSGKRPFFLAVGFRKPHLPFIFPEEFLQYYPEKSVRLADNPFAPVAMPALAWYDYHVMRSYHDIHVLNATGRINSSIPAFKALQLRRAYYSAVTYVDSRVGLVLRELAALGLANDTIVAFWGDHGYHLGENGEWTKQTNFEQATHAPLMVRVPGVTDAGVNANQLTEFVDLFPTLVDAAGLPALALCPAGRAATKVSLCREGDSLLPLAQRGAAAPWKQRVFSQFPRDGKMGYSMRTQRFRYTEWVGFSGAPLYQPDWSDRHGTELYDHKLDPEENHNRHSDPEYMRQESQLSRQLRQGWRAARAIQQH